MSSKGPDILDAQFFQYGDMIVSDLTGAIREDLDHQAEVTGHPENLTVPLSKDWLRQIVEVDLTDQSG